MSRGGGGTWGGVWRISHGAHTKNRQFFGVYPPRRGAPWAHTITLRDHQKALSKQKHRDSVDTMPYATAQSALTAHSQFHAILHHYAVLCFAVFFASSGYVWGAKQVGARALWGPPVAGRSKGARALRGPPCAGRGEGWALPCCRGARQGGKSPVGPPFRGA